MRNWLETRSGIKFNFEDPKLDDINIEDISHALSNICRYTGHSKEFYSVAEHSVYVSCVVPHRFAMSALLHDASEAYLGDVSSPLKDYIPDYKSLEYNVQSAVFEKFDIPKEIHKLVHIADKHLLVHEMRSIMPNHNESSVMDFYGIDEVDKDVSDINIRCLEPSLAKILFMKRFDSLNE